MGNTRMFAIAAALGRTVAVAAVATLLAFGPASAAWAKVKVVATLPDLACVTREVGGGDVAVTALSYPSQDPHFVDARPHLVLALNRADLLVLTGLELEVGWLPTLITGSRNPRIQPGGTGGVSGYLDASTVASLKQVPLQRVDRSMGDIHPAGNPHFMCDPHNAARVAEAIADRLSSLDPAHRNGYRMRATAFAKACDTFAKAQTIRFAAIPKEERQVVTYHQSLVYLVEWLGLNQVNTLEPKPGIPPSPGHMATVLGQMRALGVDAILQEEYWPTAPGNLLGGKVGAKVVQLPGGPNFEGGQTYMAYAKELSDKVYDGLKK